MSEWMQDPKVWTAIIVAGLSVLSSNVRVENVGKDSQGELIKMAKFYQEICNAKQ